MAAEVLYIEIHNPAPPLPPKEHFLLEALEETIRQFPPDSHTIAQRNGFWSGPTGIAYLFLHVSYRRPNLQIMGKSALEWAKAYVSLPLETEFDPEKHCGIRSETLTYYAVRAAVVQDIVAAETFASLVRIVLDKTTPVEWHSGRAGTLYLIRLVVYWLAESKGLFAEAVPALRKSILSEGPDWKFNGNRYIGAVHGDIGTIAQVALSDPLGSEKVAMSSWISRLLDWQKPDGNWPVNEEVDPRHYVQFCHGAPGFILSLQSIEPLFRDTPLASRLDQAIDRARSVVRNQGLLKKEPNLCHGLFGNGLCLESGERSSFLAHGAPPYVQKIRHDHPSVFIPAAGNFGYSALTGYWPSAAWTWLTSEDDEPRIIGFNDV